MNLARLLPGLLLLASLAGCASAGFRGPAGPEPSRRFAILACNDVYRIEGVDGGTKGGFARLRTLRRELEAIHGPVLFLHAGDFIAPSFLSRTFRGAQMIDVLNLMDGDGTAVDDRLVVTFGNHEFDDRSPGGATDLTARIRESQFTWLGTNVTFAAGDGGQAAVSGGQLRDRVVMDLGGVRVGVFSITTDIATPPYVAAIAEPEAAARAATEARRRDGCEVVVALTHLELSADRRLVEALGEDGPDVVIGGHDHEGSATLVGGRYVLKADADLRTATVAEIEVLGGRAPEVRARRVPLDASVAEDPLVAALTADWLRRHEDSFCGKRGRPAGCLSEPLGRAAVDLEAEELRIRRFETNLGSFVADQMAAAFADRGAQGAFVNGGALRLNQDLPAGTPITRRHLEELFAFPSPLRLVEIDGATLARVLARAVEDWSGNGWWLQVSGIAFRHDPATGTVSDLTLLHPSGPRAVDPAEKLRLVTIDFLVDPTRGQDGYTMLRPEHVVAEGPDLKDVVEQALRRAGDEGIAPRREGRICNTQEPGPCLAVPPR